MKFCATNVLRIAKVFISIKITKILSNKTLDFSYKYRDDSDKAQVMHMKMQFTTNEVMHMKMQFTTKIQEIQET